MVFRALKQEEGIRAEKARLEKAIEQLEEERDRLREKATSNGDLRLEVDQLRKKLDRATEANDDAFRLRSNYETLKHTCLELQDQLADYDRLVGKLENSIEEAKAAGEKSRKAAAESSNQLADLKVERNELKSALIYAETQLREVKSKHEDVEVLFTKEEAEWRRRLDDVAAVSRERERELDELRARLAGAERSGEEAGADAAKLRKQNLRLKEESSAMATNIGSLKESNLKLHAVMEEMLEKMEAKNQEMGALRDRLAVAKSELDKRELESGTQIGQLKKLVDHLQSKVRMTAIMVIETFLSLHLHVPRRTPARARSITTSAAARAVAPT